MDKLLAVGEIDFDSAASTTNQKVDFEVDPDRYRKYLNINPIWNFLSLSKDEYFNLSISDRKSHIENYYRHMLNGKKSVFRSFSFLFYFGLVS